MTSKFLPAAQRLGLRLLNICQQDTILKFGHGKVIILSFRVRITLIWLIPITYHQFHCFPLFQLLLITSQPPVDHHGPFVGKFRIKLKISNIPAIFFRGNTYSAKRHHQEALFHLLQALKALHVLDYYSKGNTPIKKSPRKNLTLLGYYQAIPKFLS